MFNRYVNNADDTLKKGIAYRHMGEILWRIGDLYSAQETLTEAINVLDTVNQKHREELGAVYNLLGNISLDSKRFNDAVEFFDRAINFNGGTDYLPEIMNGKATALQKKGNYSDAIAIYDTAIGLTPWDEEMVARMIDNLAYTKWLQNPAYNALPEFRAALKIRVDSQYARGLNASYAHLADYYARIKTDSALWYTNKMFEKAKEIHSPADRLEAIDKLTSLSQTSIVKQQWYEEFKKLNDSLQLIRDSSRNRFALIKYDFQKNKAENLVLQQDTIKQRFWIYGLIVFAILSLTLLSIWYDKRRKRIKLEAENEIHNSKLKTSQKVHDVVANGLYGIMNELEHRKTIDKEPLINKIEDLYEKSRNISQEDAGVDNPHNYDRQIHELLTAFSNDETSVFVVGNQPAFWNEITPSQKKQLKLVLTELMVNMKKHSGAKNVVVQFKKEDNLFHIHYKDDGVGFSNDVTQSGKGLENTVSRINSLNGKVTFGKNDKGGASVAINFPTQS